MGIYGDDLFDDTILSIPLAPEDEITTADAARTVEVGLPQSRGTISTIAGAIGFAVPDLVDTVSSSVGLTERDSINSSLTRAIGTPGIERFRRDIAGSTEIASGVLGIIGSELIARRITAPASLFTRTLSRMPYLRRVAQLESEYATAMTTVRSAELASARAGAMGLEQFVGTVNLGNQSMTVAAAANRARWLGAGRAAYRGAVSEAVLGIGLNENSFLYTDSAAWNTAFVGMGIAVPAGIDWLASGFLLRSIAGEADVIRAQAEALDVGGYAQFREGRFTQTLGPAGTPLAPLSGRKTDNATSYLMQAATLRNADIPPGSDVVTLSANRDRLATQAQQLAMEEIQGVVTRGLSHDGRTRFTLGSVKADRDIAGAPGVANHIKHMINEDPSAFYLVEQLGRTVDGIPGTVTIDAWRTRTAERLAEVQNAMKIPNLSKEELESLQARAARLRFEQQFTPVAFINGERLPLSELQTIEGFVEPVAKDFTFTATMATRGQKTKLTGPSGAWTISRPDNGGVVATLDENLNLTMPKGQSLLTMDHFDYLRLYRLGRKVITELAASGEAINLAGKPSWFVLDMAEEVLKRNPSAKVNFPAGMTRETAQVESLAQKAEVMGQFMKARGVLSNLTKRGRNAQLTPEQMLSRLSVQLNLPKLTAAEMGMSRGLPHPIIGVLRGASKYGPDELRNMTLADVRTTMAEYESLVDFAPAPAARDIRGKSFDYGLDRNGQAMTPMLGLLRPPVATQWVRNALEERMAMNLSAQLEALVGKDADEFTRVLASMLRDNPDAHLAAQSHTLRETQMTGAIGGKGPQSGLSAFGNLFSTSEHIGRDVPTILAAIRLADTFDRVGGTMTTAIFAKEFGDALNRLAAAGSAPTRTLLDNFHSNAGSWQLAEKAAVDSNGRWVFPLADTAENKIRWQDMFGTKMPPGATLRDPNNVIVTLDDLGMEVQQAFNRVTNQLFAAKNTLLTSMGRNNIQNRPWYVPPPPTKDRHIGFVYGPDGKPVPGMAINAKTAQEYAAKAAAMRPELEKLGVGFELRSLEDIKQFGNIWDRTLAEMMDPGITAAQPGKRNRGKMQEAFVRINGFQEALETVREQFLRHPRDIIETQFDFSIKNAQARSMISESSAPNAGRGWLKPNHRNIHDIYIQALKGQRKLDSPKSAAGAVINAAEGAVDTFLRGITAPDQGTATAAVRMWMNRANPWSTDRRAAKDFEALVQALGPSNPFTNAAELAQARGFGKVPWTSQKIASNLNAFANAITLRFFESAHALVNFGGLMASTPSVMRHYQPRVGETEAQWAARVGHTGVIVNLPNGKRAGIMDSAKMIREGMQLALSKESHPYFDDMVARGMLSQQAAEVTKQFGLIEGRDSWSRFFLGDPTIHNPKGFLEHAKAKGVTGWISILTDKSEDFTRTIASMTGLALAKRMGIVSKEAQLSFAHDVANKIIANYSPTNRAQIFQGAAGTTFGLFQSFIQGYYQRMFRYLETKDFDAMRSQYLWQAGLFGVGSVPGYAQVSSVYASLNDGGDMNYELQKRFGANASYLMEGGAISNLPALFGAPSIDLYSRGNTNPRLPGQTLFEGSTSGSESPIRQVLEVAPALNILGKFWDGMVEGFGMLADGVPNTGQQIAETISNAIVNRPLGGMIEQFAAGGADTDARGQLVSRTQSTAEAIYRIMGLRSQRQSREVQAFYSQKSISEHRSAQQSELRRAVRAAVRAGRFEELFDTFENQYLANGGDPRYFSRFLTDAQESAIETRGERALESALRSPTRARQADILLNSGITENPDEVDSMGDDLAGALGEPMELNPGIDSYEGQFSDPSLVVSEPPP